MWEPVSPSLLHVFHDVRLDSFQSLISTIGGCKHHLCPIIREACGVNHPVKANLINKRLCLFFIPVVPCWLVYLNNFLRYHVKGLDGRNPLRAYHRRLGVSFVGHVAVVPGCTCSVGCSKCYGEQGYPSQ